MLLDAAFDIVIRENGSNDALRCTAPVPWSGVRYSSRTAVRGKCQLSFTIATCDIREESCEVTSCTEFVHRSALCDTKRLARRWRLSLLLARGCETSEFRVPSHALLFNFFDRRQNRGTMHSSAF